MPRLNMLPVLLRETFSSPTLPREPEPDLVMEDEKQVDAFSEAGRIDGVMSASYLFNSARISQAIQGCKRVIDLGCGPATQLAQIAELNPEIEFIGIDLSATMLKNAEQYIKDLKLNNVRFIHDDISTLKKISDQSVDGVISTLALHHLPSDRLLTNCFQQISRVMRSGGALFLIDLGRLKSLKSVIFFAYMNEKNQPHLFSLDYERSLRAAFLPEDFQANANSLPFKPQVCHTFKIPVLIITKTEDKPLPPIMQQRMKEMHLNLPQRYRNDLDDIRLFFKLGGLKNDPFK